MIKIKKFTVYRRPCGMEQKSSKILAFLMKIGDLFFLNILYILCCIPVVTAGAATSALYHCTVKMVRKEESYLTKDFFSAFRRNFVKATILYLAAAAVYAVLAGDFYLSRFLPSGIQPLLLAVLIILAVFFSLIAAYLVPLVDYYGKSIADIVKTAFFLAFSHVFRSFIMVFMNALIPALLLIYPAFFLRILPLIGFLGFSSVAYANSRIFLSAADPDALHS